MAGLEEATPVEGLTLSVPPGLSRGSEQGADSDVRTLNGPGISILIDRGPFVDNLTSYEGRAGAQPDQETIGGHTRPHDG